VPAQRGVVKHGARQRGPCGLAGLQARDVIRPVQRSVMQPTAMVVSDSLLMIFANGNPEVAGAPSGIRSGDIAAGGRVDSIQSTPPALKAVPGVFDGLRRGPRRPRPSRSTTPERRQLMRADASAPRDTSSG